MHRLLQIQREREGERLLVFRVRASVIKMRTAENREGSGDAVAEEGEEKKKEKKRDGRKRKREIGRESKEKSEDPSALIGAHKYRIFILNGKTNDRSMPLVPGPH